MSVRVRLIQLRNRTLLSNRRADQKIFCIGWLKTGTTSFGSAMRRLGYHHQTFNRYIFREWFNKGRLDRLLYHALSYDSFDDLPWNRIGVIELTAKFFPNSRFVLLERDKYDWFNSFQSHANLNDIHLSHKKQQLIDWYESRNLYLKQFFYAHEFEDRFLIMNLFAGDGYERLCPFLGEEELNEEFPHLNKSKQI